MSAIDTKKQIADGIEAFASGDLSANALHLLKTLGYHSDLRAPLKKRTYAEFDDLYVRGNERFNTKNALTAQWLSIDLLFQLTADQLTKQDSLFKNEKVDQKEINSYLFFVIELKAKANGYTRTELSQITREVNKLFAMPAMLLFKHGDTITLSVIDRRLHKREASKDVLEKVTLIKDIRTAAPHRAHIEILFDLSIDELRRVHGFTTFPALHEAWRKTLDTKELNKRFFRELANWYFHAVEVAEFPDDIEKDREKRNAINTIRLITRLMFVWFLREKDLVPDALFDKEALGLGGKGSSGGKGGRSTILKPDAKEKSLYYKAILQNLFFATLNTEMGDKRRFRIEADRSLSKHYFIHNVFRYERCFTDPKATLKDVFAPIPFLNGGLFECLDKQVEQKGKLVPVRIDGFSDRDDNPLHVPDKLFFDPEGEELDFSAVYGTTRTRKEKVRGLIDILSSYKFTIVENTPIEEEVALDPELLGKVFENLLANYNPETKTTARKQTGSFYTPREIVNYMVDESLIAYLKSALTPGPSPPERGEMPASGDAPTWAEKPGYMTGDPATAAKLMAYANAMRKDATQAEDKLWQAIRGHATGGRIRRQHIIGNFIVDFVSLPKRLVIEVDGDIHDLQKEEDEARTALLSEYGFKVIRFRNEEVLGDVFAVKRAIVAELDARPDVSEALSPSPSERGQGGEGVLDERTLTPALSEGEGERRLRHLLSYTEEPHTFTKAETERLIAAIDACKILDPACGSGAFPMGVLHKLVHVLHKLDPQNKQWKERQIEKASALDDADIRERTIADIEDAFANNALDYGRKLYLIENGIYGVDIQPIAMQIAKLRFFISLIVDQRARPYTPLLGRGAGGEGALHDNRGVRALPNLETKFVAANTLMKLEKENANLFTNPAIEKKKEQLKRVRHDYFEARTPQRKARCRELDKSLREELADLLVQNHDFQPKTAKMLAGWDPYDQNASAPFFDTEWMYGLAGGFDVVIGNPPYIKEYTYREAFEGLRDSSYYQGKMDIWYIFACQGLDVLREGTGVLSFIATNNWTTNSGASRLREKLGSDAQLLSLVDFGSFMVFESASIQTMVLTALRNSSQKSYRFRLARLVQAHPTFEDVIRALAHESNSGVQCLTPVMDRKSSEGRLFTFANNDATAVLDHMEKSGKLRLDGRTEVAQGIVAPQDKVSRAALANINHQASIGDGIFVLSNAEKDALNLNAKEAALVRPYYTSKELGRYHADKQNREWIIYTDSSFEDPGSMRGLPNLKKHLDKFQKVITSDCAPYGLHRSRDESFFKGPRVISMRKCLEPTFSFVDYDCYVSQTFNIIKTDRIDLKCLTGILNSSVAAFWFRHRGKMQGQNFQIDLEPLVSLPLVIPPAKVKAQLEKLVEKRLGLEAGAKAEAVEREIDQVVYGLYGLTEEEIKIVEGSGKRKGD